MDDGKRGRSAAPVLSKGVITVASLVVLLTAAVSLVVLLWAFGRGTEQNKTQLDAVRTAASIALGTGGAAALLLAARRQQTAEQVAVDTRQDASERRMTELYTKAADQLGADKAPVRLAGLYALERLAQDNPEHRQTIVNLICAYLRMPYTPPADPGHTPDTATGDAEGTAASAGETAEQREKHERQEQEKQVRLTAQRILAAHLRPETDARDRRTSSAYWPQMELDLTNATLLDFNLVRCHLHRAVFDGAWFSGPAGFDGAWFSGYALFDGAKFSGPAGFAWARFSGDAVFAGARFSGYAGFDGAQFSGDAVFDAAQFSGDARFDAAQFRWNAGFKGAQFSGNALFPLAELSGYAGFDRAQFSGDAVFDAARFSGDAVFDGAQFSGYAGFTGAHFSGNAGFTGAHFGGTALFQDAQFSHGANLEDARVRVGRA